MNAQAKGWDTRRKKQEAALEEAAQRGAAQASTPPKKECVVDPWANRPKGMVCATCMAYVAKAPAGDGRQVPEVGRCRRHAPTMSGYPVVFPSDWCGDHKLDENKL